MPLIDFHFFVHQKVNEKLTAIPKTMITLVNNPNDINPYLENFDAIIVNTFHRNFEQYQFIFKEKPTLCLIHNLNFSLFFKNVNCMNLILEKERFLYYFKLYFSEKVAKKRKNILKSSHYGVLSESLLQEVVSKSLSIALKTDIISLNYIRQSNFEISNTINIVMPGNVSNKRKDVDLILEILPKLKPKSKLHFTFLGKPESESILHRIENLKTQCSNKISITYYSKFIPWQEYCQVIAKSHLLLCPIRSKTSFYWVNEMYGKTKVSGSETDCIYNGKIGIFPSTYPKMNWHNLYYKNNVDLQSILNSLTFENLKLEYLKLNPFLEDYSFEKVKNKLENQLIMLASK